MNTKTARPASPLKAILGLLTLTAGGAVAGYGVASLATQAPAVLSRMQALSAWDLLALPLIMLLTIAVHEGGHVIGGLRRGMRFLLLIVGPLKLSRSEAGLRFEWVFNLGTLGGLAACAPDPDRPLAPQLKSLISGGPLASVLLALLAAAVAALDEGRWGAYGLITSGLSALIFLLTIIPSRIGGHASDGMQLRELARGGEAAELRGVLAALTGQSLAGCRPAALDQQLIKKALELGSSDPVQTTVARLYAMMSAWDAGDLAIACEHADWIADHVAQFPDGFRQGLCVELAHFSAQRGDADGARQWLSASRGGVVDITRRALAEAALARLSGNEQRCHEQLAVARKELARSLDPGSAAFSAQQIEQLGAAPTLREALAA